MAKPFQPDFALPDMFVPIDPRTQARLGIVEMKSEYLLSPDQLVKLPDGFVPALTGANIVTRREKMRRVNTKAQPRRRFDRLINRRQVFKLIPQTTPLPRRVFEGNPHLRVLGCAQRFIQSRHDL